MVHSPKHGVSWSDLPRAWKVIWLWPSYHEQFSHAVLLTQLPRFFSEVLPRNLRSENWLTPWRLRILTRTSAEPPVVPEPRYSHNWTRPHIRYAEDSSRGSLSHEVELVGWSQLKVSALCGLAFRVFYQLFGIPRLLIFMRQAKRWSIRMITNCLKWLDWNRYCHGKEGPRDLTC